MAFLRRGASDFPFDSGNRCFSARSLRGRSVTSVGRFDRFGRMPISYLPYEPQQQRLLPDALQDWLPEGHLAYFISDSVDSLDLSAFHARYAKGGPRNQPFHPAMMVKVLIYGYATGTFSSRKLAAKLHEDVALRVLAPITRSPAFLLPT